MKKVKFSLGALAVVAAIVMSFTTKSLDETFTITDPNNPAFGLSGLTAAQAKDRCPGEVIECAVGTASTIIKWQGATTKF